MSIKEKFIAAIEATGDPLAPIKLQDAYSAANAVGKMLALGGADKDKAVAFFEQLTKDFPEDMNHIGTDPSFICALCSMLSESLVRYGANLTNRRSGK